MDDVVLAHAQNALEAVEIFVVGDVPRQAAILEHGHARADRRADIRIRVAAGAQDRRLLRDDRTESPVAWLHQLA